jgi:hypothetical protein
MSQLIARRPVLWMVRIGYLARGIIFLIIGGFALLAAGGLGAHPEGARDAMEFMFQKPFGGYVLWTLAVGLACFALWRLLQAIADTEGHGTSLYGLLRRSVLAGSGVFYLALAVATARVTVERRRISEDQSAREWTAWLMSQPLGRALLALLAAGFVGVAIGLTIEAIRANYRHELDATPEQRIMAVVLGSYGLLTRAFVFFILAFFLAVTAFDANSQEAVGLAGVLTAMQNESYGGVFLGVAALGLLAFGFFEIIEAVARRNQAGETADRKSRLIRGLFRSRPRSASG